MTRVFKTREELEQERLDLLKYMPGAQQQLPTDKLLVVYGRQSTVKQFVNNKESAQQQAIDLLDYGLTLGWSDNKRQLFIENQLADGTIKNASGRLRIDQRPGLQEVTRLIETGEVGAVLVRSIDRLFRDETMVAPVAFAEICTMHHVLILTFDDLYDFSNPKRDDLNRFITEALKAKDYIKHHVKGLMLKMRDKKGMRGEYSGHAIPTGLMLDEEHVYYVPNPYFAPVMKRLLKRFRELDGDFAQFRREIIGKPIFPNVPDEIIKRVGRVQLTKVEGGYTVKSYAGMRSMLTNVALIGHIAYKNRIVKRNAHPAIVDEVDFWFCFERLSPTGIDGIPHTVRVKRYATASSGALLQGTRDTGQAVLTSTQRAVYVTPQGSRNKQQRPFAYTIHDNHKIALSNDVACIRVEVLDKIFVHRLLERLNSFRQMHAGIDQLEGEIIDKTVFALLKEVVQGRLNEDDIVLDESPYGQLQGMVHGETMSLVSIPESIAQAKREIARLKRDYEVNFDLMTDKELRDNRQARLQLARDIEEMEQKQNEAAATAQDKKDVELLLQDVYGVWPTLSLEKQRRFIRLVTHSIELDVMADGWLLLFINWSPYMGYDATDMAFIWQQKGAGKTWTEAENCVLREQYATADRADILHALPTRSWTSICAHAYTLGLHRHTQLSSTRLHPFVSIEDKRIMDGYLLFYDGDVAGQQVWWRFSMKRFEEGLSVHGIKRP